MRAERVTPERPHDVASQLRVLLGLRQLDQPIDAAAVLHRPDDPALHVDRRLLLIELPELLVSAHVAELRHGFGAQLRVLFALRGLQQPILVARHHEGAENAPLHVDVGRRAINLAEHRTGLGSAMDAKILNRLALKIRRRRSLWRSSGALPARAANCSAPARTTLAASPCGDAVPFDALLEDRHGLFW